VTGPGAYPTAPMGRMGEPPGGPLDYVIVAVAMLVVVLTAIQTIRWLVAPGENAPDHIKRVILDDEPAPRSTDQYP
jgi:hypothetical protein